jgi:hypothetical protein
MRSRKHVPFERGHVHFFSTPPLRHEHRLRASLVHTRYALAVNFPLQCHEELRRNDKHGTMSEFVNGADVHVHAE